MTEWAFDYHEVLEDGGGYWWHVVNRYECIDTGEQYYRLFDGTHTGDRWVHATDAVDMYDPAGWHTDSKPAHEHGFRVNGVLCEPETMDRYFNTACVSDWDCPECGEPTTGEADVVKDLEGQHINTVEIVCGACGCTREVGDND